MVSLCCINQEILRFFVRGLPFGRPSWFSQRPASFSNLVDLMVDFWLDSFSWLSVAVVLGSVADNVEILFCLCYNLNGQKLSSNTLSTQLPNVLSNFSKFVLNWQLTNWPQ